MTRNRLNDLGSSLGEHLREQRQSARLSLRQLSELAGVSNPYLSQIERGLKRPSAEILQQLAKALEVSAESLYVRAGILEDREMVPGHGSEVRHAIAADPVLTDRQRSTLLDVYESFVGAAGARLAATPAPSTPPVPAAASDGTLSDATAHVAARAARPAAKQQTRATGTTAPAARPKARKAGGSAATTDHR